MGWKDLAKLGKDFVEAKKDELLTTDADKKAEARARADAAKDGVTGEVGTSFLENVLPADLAKVVTDHRPENVAAREAEKAVAAEAKRRTDLSARPTAQLQLTISGEEQGSVVVSLPFDRTEGRLLLEALDPVPVGTTTLFSLSISVPDYRGAPGHYDLAELYRRGETGQIESWEVFDLFLSPDAEFSDATWYWDSSSWGSIDVAESSVSFDLPMVSAASTIRATGIVTWA
jgi:hypothetical protein